jgi:protein-L-isoaspartate(D-aspartate) O-methyltransferase
MNIETARFNMIEQQIRPWNVLDASVLDLLSIVKREDFVPPSHKGLAFADLEIPLRGTGEESLAQGQCMLEPRVEARMLQELAVQPHETVLEVGTGCGYTAALLGKKALRVVTVEIHSELVAQARESLRNAGISNVEVRQGDGSKLTAADGSFDAIALSGSVAQVPANLLKLLKSGGRLVAIVGDEPVMRCTVVTKTGENTYHTQQSWDTVAPRLQNFPEPTRFTF